MRSLFLSSTFLAATAGLGAQATVIGLTANIQAISQQDMNTCQTQSCNVTLLGGSTGNPWDGGTAVDMTRGGVWVTNGVRVAMVNPDTCAVMCPPFTPTVGGTITGLAMHEPSGNIYALTTANALYTIAATCPWQIITRCPLAQVIPAGWVAAGLAVSDPGDYIFIAAADPAVPGTATVFVTTVANPCTPICRIPASRCGGNPMGVPTGAGFDPCTNMLYVTDGRFTTEIRVDVPTCQFTFARCCRNNNPNGDPYIGLCFMPARSTSTGRGCTQAPCALCTPTHTVSTVPYPGNPAFNLLLSGAPSGGVGYLLMGQGPCQAVGIPFSCDALRTLPLWGAFGPVPLGGGGGCTGSGSVPIGIPNNYGLCGLQVATQWYVICPTGGSGLSNCVTWTISGS
ncbi:MAG: hypothetical protein R3F56_21735 [Planctomycetota bacterium]